MPFNCDASDNQFAAQYFAYILGVPRSCPIPNLMKRSLLLTAVLCLGTCHSTLADDWRQWRGPHRDGHVGEAAKWPGSAVAAGTEGDLISVRRETPLFVVAAGVRG